MAVSSRQEDRATAVVESKRNPPSEGAGDKERGKIAAATLHNSPSLAQVREEKVLGIREQLARGTYDLDEHLDAVLESVLEDLTA